MTNHVRLQTLPPLPKGFQTSKHTALHSIKKGVLVSSKIHDLPTSNSIIHTQAQTGKTRSNNAYDHSKYKCTDIPHRINHRFIMLLLLPPLLQYRWFAGSNNPCEWNRFCRKHYVHEFHNSTSSSTSSIVTGWTNCEFVRSAFWPLAPLHKPLSMVKSQKIYPRMLNIISTWNNITLTGGYGWGYGSVCRLHLHSPDKTD